MTSASPFEVRAATSAPREHVAFGDRLIRRSHTPSTATICIGTMLSEYSSYFAHRRVSAETYSQYLLPVYLESRLPQSKDARILDFGCGFGQFVRELRKRDYPNAVGYDIEPTAVEACRAEDIPIVDGTRFGLADLPQEYDLILASHVLEHIPKEQVVAMPCNLRRLLKPTGMLLICVPNAQANTGCYWAYEDFTHYTAYTSGSLYYVLSKAGFSKIEFIDVDCTEGMRLVKRTIKRLLLSVYKANYRLWNKVTSSATHSESPNIFSYEVKAIAYV